MSFSNIKIGCYTLISLVCAVLFFILSPSIPKVLVLCVGSYNILGLITELIRRTDESSKTRKLLSILLILTFICIGYTLCTLVLAGAANIYLEVAS